MNTGLYLLGAVWTLAVVWLIIIFVNSRLMWCSACGGPDAESCECGGVS